MKKLSSFCLALVLLFTLTAASAAPPAGTEQALVKDETVYANLNYDGSLDQVYVVNRIETPNEGVYKDFGNYKRIQNLSGADSPVLNGSEISWQPKDKVLYYQGWLDKGELPFIFELAYSLDGVAIKPEQAVGKAGAVAITLKVAANPRAKQYFRDNYVAQIQIPLDLEIISAISAPGATAVVAGKQVTLAYTVLPKQDSVFVLEFDTVKFELDAISISCIPFDAGSFLDFDAAEITEGFGQLTDGFDQMVGGSKKLRNGLTDLKNGLGQLSAGADQVAAGNAELAANIPQLLAGARELQQGASALDDGIGQLSGGAGGIAGGASDLANGISAYLGGIGEIAGNAQELSGGLGQLAGEGDKLNYGYSQLVAGLNGALAGLPEQLGLLGLTPEQLASLASILQGMDEQLNSSLDEFGQGLQLYTGGVSAAAAGMGALAGGLETVATEGQGLVVGAKRLASGASSFEYGVSRIGTGSYELAAGLSAFVEESQGLNSGAEALAAGALSLAKGLREITTGTNRLPGDVQKLIDAQVRMQDGFASAAGLLADFELPEGNQQPVSFVSEKIIPRSVQFVANTPALKVKAETAPVPEEPEQANGFFNRLLRLFGLGK